MAKEAYYFSHDSNARSDEKILQLRAEFGWEGYGLYWAIIETLRESSDYSFSSNAKAGLAISLNTTKEKLNDILELCFNESLLIEKDGRFFSESLMTRMEQVDEKRRKRAEAGRLGGIAKASLKQKSSNALANSSKESKVKEKKGKGKEQLNIDEIYSIYPTKCPVRNCSTGKSKSNKIKIKSLLKTNTVEELKSTIERYVSECKLNNAYIKNFSTFLNNIPDYSEAELPKNKLYTYFLQDRGTMANRTEKQYLIDKKMYESNGWKIRLISAK